MNEGTTALERPHSPIGPSSFDRVETCSASAVIAMHAMPEKSSVYAAEGTAAHVIFESCMGDRSDPWEYLEKGVTVEGTHFPVDTEMVEALTLAVNAARQRLPDRVFEVEVKLDLPGTMMFGTADIYAGFKLPVRVLDLKYGVGVKVPASTNQLGIYALMGLVRDFGQQVLIDGADDEVLAVSTVLQPRGRADFAVDWEWTREALRGLYVRVIAVNTKLKARDMHYAYSEHCRWCPAVTSCPLLHTMAVDAAMSNICTNTAVPLTNDLLDAAVLLLAPLDLYAKRVSEAAVLYMQQGGNLTNAKLVEKRATRQWADIDAAVTWLDTHGIEPFGAAPMLSPAQIEKKLPSSLKPSLAHLVTKESSGLTMAMRDDPRPEVSMTAEKGKAALLQQQARAILARANKPTENGETR